MGVFEGKMKLLPSLLCPLVTGFVVVYVGYYMRLGMLIILLFSQYDTYLVCNLKWHLNIYGLSKDIERLFKEMFYVFVFLSWEKA